MIESFSIKEYGYHPFLIKEGWQMAQLNYTDEQHIDPITRFDVHLETDEVFVPINGNAVLIVASIIDDDPIFEVELMQLNTIFNIPQDVWHNIAMEQGSQVLIAEKSNTHIFDFDHFSLSKNKQEELKSMVYALFDSIKD